MANGFCDAASIILAAEPAQRVDDWQIGLALAAMLDTLPTSVSTPSRAPAWARKALEERALTDARLATEKNHLAQPGGSL